MGDEAPPPCPDWFSWWLKHEYCPFQREMQSGLAKALKGLTAKKVAMETAKPIVYGLLGVLATRFPELKHLIGSIAP
jgi:hypothetical protein